MDAEQGVLKGEGSPLSLSVPWPLCPAPLHPPHHLVPQLVCWLSPRLVHHPQLVPHPSIHHSHNSSLSLFLILHLVPPTTLRLFLSPSHNPQHIPQLPAGPAPPNSSLRLFLTPLFILYPPTHRSAGFCPPTPLRLSLTPLFTSYPHLISQAVLIP